MLEREKQRTDQQKKHAAEKQRRARPGKDDKGRVERKQAGMATDPQAMKDKGYIERIDEKTEKH